MSNLVTYNYNDLPVLFQTDGYLNATQIAKGFGKKPNDWLRLESTKDYLIALEKSLNSVAGKSVTVENQLVITKQGGLADEQGTWIHPKLATVFARWLNAEFAVWCDIKIEELLNNGTVSMKPLSQLEILAQSVIALVEMDKRQTALELAQQNQAEEIKQLSAKIEKSPHEYYTVAGFASLRDVRINVREAAMIGRKCVKLAKE